MSLQSSRLTRPTTTLGGTASSQRSRPYDGRYGLKLIRACIFTEIMKDSNNKRIRPDNYDEIAARLKQPRSSLSPSRFSEGQFERFQEQNERDDQGDRAMSRSITYIEGTNDHLYLIESKFNNLEPFNPELATPMPTSYDGAPPLSIDHRVLDQLDAYIVPNVYTSRPALPNFFLEVKSTQERSDVGKIQAAHYGALGARGMNMIQSFPNTIPMVYDNNAYSFTSTYHDGTLKMYTSHATAPKTPGTGPQYYMTLLDSFSMTGNSKTFREGATQYRNARDLAKEQRDAFIKQANQKARQLPTGKHGQRSRATTRTLSMSTSFQDEEEHENSQDTDTSVDELAVNKASKR